MHLEYAIDWTAFNVSNLLGVIAAMRCLGVPLNQAVGACSNYCRCPVAWSAWVGTVAPWLPWTMHIPLTHWLRPCQALRPIADSNAMDSYGACVWLRWRPRSHPSGPLMGAIAAKYALTKRGRHQRQPSRRNTPRPFISQISAGPGPKHEAVEVQSDRAHWPLPMPWRRATANDVVLVAGKGHEAYSGDCGREASVFSDLNNTLPWVCKRLGLWPCTSSGEDCHDEIHPSPDAMVAVNARRWWVMRRGGQSGNSARSHRHPHHPAG